MLINKIHMKLPSQIGNRKYLHPFTFKYNAVNPSICIPSFLISGSHFQIQLPHNTEFCQTLAILCLTLVSLIWFYDNFYTYFSTSSLPLIQNSGGDKFSKEFEVKLKVHTLKFVCFRGKKYFLRQIDLFLIQLFRS